MGVKIPNASYDQQAVSTKFARKFMGPYRVIDVLPNGVSYLIEDVVSGVIWKVNRVNLKLYALPSDPPPTFPDLPPHFLGVPSVRLGIPTNTRETVNLQADLPRVAEEVHRPTHEGIVTEGAPEDTPSGLQDPSQAQGNRTRLRPTLARRARAGDPDAHYQLR